VGKITLESTSYLGNNSNEQSLGQILRWMNVIRSRYSVLQCSKASWIFIADVRRRYRAESRGEICHVHLLYVVPFLNRKGGPGRLVQQLVRQLHCRSVQTRIPHTIGDIVKHPLIHIPASTTGLGRPIELL
jgi:hypothetical protein